MFKENFLKETHKVDADIDISQVTSYFNDVFESTAKPSLVALLGEHGSGKSTMLYELKKKNNQLIDWFFFDAWKYPRRSELWEGFITEITKELKLDEKAVARIKANSTKNEGAYILSKTLEAVQSVGGIPGLKVVGDLVSKLFQDDPITKLEGFQELLKVILSKREKPIYIVIEDIDRSKDQGLFFIETLRFFLNETELENNDIVVIVPMSKENYNKEKSSYLKCFDIVETFSLKDINFDKFVKNGLSKVDALKSPILREDTDFKTIYLQISSFLSLLMNKFQHITIREIKLILRNANKRHKSQLKQGLNPDFRVTLCIEAMMHIPKPTSNGLTYWAHSLGQGGIIKTHAEEFAAFLTLILTTTKTINEHRRGNYLINNTILVDDDGDSPPLYMGSARQPSEANACLLRTYFI